MRLASASTKSRPAFTLIEMLLVIAIVGILAALLLGAIMRSLGVADTLKVKNEVSQLDVALQSFKTTYGFFPPSRIKLCKRRSDYGATLLDADSVFYLTQMATRITDSTALTPSDPNYNAARPRTRSPWMCTNTSGTPYVANVEFADWDGTGNYDPANPALYTVILEGDQCLVFFLNGIPTNSGGIFGGTGFSKSPLNPADTSASSRNGPFYSFDSTRLTNGIGHPNVGGTSTGTNYFSYQDPFGTPYVYFSSYKAANGYNRYATLTTPDRSDCDAIGVWPYAMSITLGPPVIGTYQAPNTYQIISAGPNKNFGPGSNPTATTPPTLLWFADTANDVFAPTDAGADDVTNFHDKPMGTPRSAK
jgi:prepilin-type N-terminal cleavage/methylation domain-containing protein